MITLDASRIATTTTMFGAQDACNRLGEEEDFQIVATTSKNHIVLPFSLGLFGHVLRKKGMFFGVQALETESLR